MCKKFIAHAFKPGVCKECFQSALAHTSNALQGAFSLHDRYWDMRISEYEGMRVRGCEGTRVRGYEGTKVRGYEGARV